MSPGSEHSLRHRLKTVAVLARENPMSSNKAMRLVKLLPVVVVVSLLLVTACVRDDKVPPVAFANPRSAFDMKVTLAKAPLLYEPVTVAVEVSPKSVGRDDVEVWLSLPRHAVLLDGETAWHGPLYPGDTKTLTATIAFLKEGNTYVGVQAEYPSPEHRPNRLVGSAYLDLNIGKTSSRSERVKEEYVQRVSWLGNDPAVRPF